MTDLRRDSPLLTRKLGVSLSPGEESAQLSLQVLPGVRQHSNGQQENFLHFEITNDVDLYFLYTFEIGEHDFHNLKKEQHIVVDFNAFPAKFIALIDLCCQHPDQGQSSSFSKYVAKLNLSTAVFSIVEVNEFNHVSRLQLQFRPGNDDSIKAYLSSSLKFSLEANRRLTHEHESLQNDYQDKCRRLEEVTKELRCFREETERDQHLLQSRHDQSMAQQHQAHLDALKETEQQAKLALQELRDSTDKELKQNHSRIIELEKELNEENAGRREAEFTVRKLQGEIEKNEAESAFYKSSSSDSAAQLRARDQELAACERELAQVKAKKEALENQILDKEEILNKATSLREAAEQSRDSAIEKLELYQSGLSAAQEKLQTAVSEINRGNEAIQQLQHDLQIYKSKVQNKSEVIRKQEKVVEDLRSRLAASSREEAKLKDDLALGAQQRELLERELASARNSISEGADIIKKNQDVIDHLNEMINSLQVGGGAGAYGSGQWSSPVKPSGVQHYSYHQSDSNDNADDKLKSASERTENYSSPQDAQASRNVPSHFAKEKYANKVSPDSVATGFPEDKYSSSHYHSQHHSSYSSYKTPTTRYSLSPQDQYSRDYSDNQKGYYDGVLDPTLLERRENNDRAKSSSHIPGITRSSRKSLAPYSWQLDDFGREDD